MRVKLSGILRFFISSPNSNIVTGVTLNTTVSLERVEKALYLLAQKHPFFQMVPTINEKNEAYLVSKPGLKISIKEYQDTPYQVITQQELQTVHQLDKKALIHFVLNQRKTQTDLLLVANHAICDGMSLNTIIAHIVQVLNGHLLKNIPKHQPIENIAPPMEDSWSKNVLVKLVNKVWQKKNFVLTQSMIDQVYKDYWTGRETRISIEDFSPEMTAAIVKHCKKMPYSVNTFLGTLLLYAREASGIYKESSITNFIITANIRSKLLQDPGESMGCYVNSIKLDLPKHYKLSIDAYARTLQQKVLTWFNSSEPLSLLGLVAIKPSVIDAVNLNSYGLRRDFLIQKLLHHFDLKKVNTELILTNYGRMKPDISGEYQIEAYLPVVISSAMNIEKYVTICTYKERLRIGLCYDANVISDQNINTYINTFKRLLKKQLSINESQH